MRARYSNKVAPAVKTGSSLSIIHIIRSRGRRRSAKNRLAGDDSRPDGGGRPAAEMGDVAVAAGRPRHRRSPTRPQAGQQRRVSMAGPFGGLDGVGAARHRPAASRVFPGSAHRTSCRKGSRGHNGILKALHSCHHLSTAPARRGDREWQGTRGPSPGRSRQESRV